MRKWVSVVAALFVLAVLYSALWSSGGRRGASGASEAEGDVAAATAQVDTRVERPAVAGATDQVTGEEAAAEPERPAVPSRGGMLNPTGILMSAFQSEPRDALWAEEKEREVHRVLSDPELPRGIVKSAECRTTVCRVELSWPETAKTDYKRLNYLVGANWAPQIGIEYPPGARDSRRLNIYIIRRGYSVADVAP